MGDGDMKNALRIVAPDLHPGDQRKEGRMTGDKRQEARMTQSASQDEGGGAWTAKR
jgi:hypothetical protein